MRWAALRLVIVLGVLLGQLASSEFAYARSPASTYGDVSTYVAGSISFGVDSVRNGYDHNRGMAMYVDAADAFTRPGDSDTTGGVRLRPLVELVAPKVPAADDDLLKPGPWATESVPSSAPGKITQAERNLLNPIGDASGTPEVLYPHCQKCRNAQGLWIINLMRQGKL